MRPFLGDHWGDLASVFGVLLAIAGFGASLWQIRKTRRASEAAADAVAGLRRDWNLFDLATEMARAKSIMEEIKRLHRTGAWQVLPDRYQTLRECLVLIRDSGTVQLEHHRVVIAAVIKQFRLMEERVEKSINTKVQSPSPTALNTIVSEQHEQLSEVFAAVKTNLGK